MEINENDIKSCLAAFGIQTPLARFAMLADGPDHPVPYDVIRKILLAELQSGERYVIKFIREPIFPAEIIEQQSAFSDLLRKNGILTPYRRTRNGHYCVPYEKAGLQMSVTLEEWVGEKLQHIDPELFAQIGALLGKIHRISQKSGMKIGFSLLYNEITAHKDTSFERLWHGVSHDFIPQAEEARILALYEKRLTKVKGIWSSLPRAAVQGDIYSCNNIARRDGRLAVYDFNLAGDEVLIGDILLCWFRTVFDENRQQDIRCFSTEELWRCLVTAY